jgi:chromate transporter
VREVAAVFFKLGVIGFGGPVAHLALMEEELVGRRKWLTREHFLDLIGLTNLIPGPNSTEMAIHLGYLRAGWRGLILAGVCFLLPAVVLTTGVAWLYQRYGTLATARAALAGIEPAVLAIIGGAAWRLGRTAVRGVAHALLGAVLAAAVLLRVDPVLVLFGGVALGTLVLARPARGKVLVALPELFLVFLKVGAVLYGSGYVLVAFLERELVGRGWLTHQQLLDAVAVGQVTPGPVLSTATFLGYGLGGGAGAVVATVGIFLPSFVFVAVLGPLADRLRKTAWAAPFLAAVRVSALALLAAAVVPFARGLDLRGVAIAVVALALSIRFQVAAHWLILGAGALGLLLYPC